MTLPADLADVMVALAQHATNEGASAELAEALNVLLAVVSVTVPGATRSVSPALVRRAALNPLLDRVQNLASPIEEELFSILADVGLALDFRNGKSVPVRYADRLSGPQEGLATPDAYHPWTRCAIFCDSSRHHSSNEDRARDNGVNAACMLRGITPLRFTTEQIRFSREEVASVILAHLGKRARPATGPATAA